MYNHRSIFNAMDDILTMSNPNNFYAKTDVQQIENGWRIQLLLPGFEKGEINIRTEGNDLVLDAKTERELPKFLNKHVKKTFQIEDLDAESIKAALESGILTIEFSTEKRKNTRKISIL